MNENFEPYLKNSVGYPNSLFESMKLREILGANGSTKIVVETDGLLSQANPNEMDLSF